MLKSLIKIINKFIRCFLLIVLVVLITLINENKYNEGQNKMLHKIDILFPNGAKQWKLQNIKGFLKKLHTLVLISFLCFTFFPFH